MTFLITASHLGFWPFSVFLVKNSSETSQTLVAATRLLVKGRSFLQKPKTKSNFTLVHLSAVIFASIIILISALLGRLITSKILLKN